MLQPSRRNFLRIISTYRPFLRPLLLGGTLALTSACSTFFKLSPEEEAAGAAAKPGTAAKAPAPPAPKVEKPSAEKPKVEKPKVEKPKPEATKVESPKVEKPKVEAPKTEIPKVEKPKDAKISDVKGAVVTPPPPSIRRSEPVIEPMALEPTPAGSDTAGIARLMHAAALWDAVRLFHPTAAVNRAQWDNETVRRLTDVRSATTRAQYATVMREWLSRLNDPVTRLVEAGTRTSVSTASNGPADIVLQTQVVVTGAKKTRVVDSTLIVTWPASRSSLDTTAWTNLRNALRENISATQVVIDLRARPVGDNTLSDNTLAFDASLSQLQLDVANLLATRAATGASIRRRVYEGWPDDRDGAISPAGAAAWRVSDATVLVTPSAVGTQRRVAIVADSNTVIAPAFMALVSTKQITLVADGPLSDRFFVPTTSIAMGNGFVANVRVGELINVDGNVGLKPDTMLAAAASASDSAPALRVAVQVARGKVAPRAAVSSHTNTSDAGWTSNTIASNMWTTAHYPIMGARLLSAIKMWATLRTFHAYNEIRDENVDDALARFIPRVEAATDPYSFTSVMLDFATTTNDAQVEMTSPTIVQHLGAAAAPFTTRWIENRAIVTQVAADEAGRATGLSVGDEITVADGYPMAAYMSEHRRYSAASNDWTGYRNSTQLIPRGVPGNAVFKVRDASNRERTVTIARSPLYLNRFASSERTSTSVFRTFTGSIGYLDLNRASTEQVDSAFQMFTNTRALIIDARGRDTPNAKGAMTPAMVNVLRRVAALPNAVIDKQTIRVASEACAPTESRLPSATCVLERRQFDDIISADTSKRYKGRVVVLIDERTQGAMEQFGLGAEGAGNSVFIGSPSAGAAGALTSVKLPGLITLVFSGSELRHADGRQLQRVGITPQVDVAPTVKGVRAGNDEVLARAQEWLLQQLDPSTKRKK